MRVGGYLNEYMHANLLWLHLCLMTTLWQQLCLVYNIFRQPWQCRTLSPATLLCSFGIRCCECAALTCLHTPSPAKPCWHTPAFEPCMLRVWSLEPSPSSSHPSLSYDSSASHDASCVTMCLQQLAQVLSGASLALLLVRLLQCKAPSRAADRGFHGRPSSSSAVGTAGAGDSRGSAEGPGVMPCPVLYPWSDGRQDLQLGLVLMLISSCSSDAESFADFGLEAVTQQVHKGVGLNPFLAYELQA